MKTIKLQITFLTALIMLFIIACLLYPLLIILAVFMPHTFKTLLLKLVNTLNLVSWLYEVAETTEDEYEV